MEMLASFRAVVCPACGVVAPRHARVCENCDGSLERSLAVEEERELYWTAVECSFECKACRRRSPLDSLDFDGTLQCASCGVKQEFEVQTWRAPLGYAHAVGDLAGPDPEGRFASKPKIGERNDLKHIGVDRAFFEAPENGARRLTLRAAPGHPLCSACRTPLVIGHQSKDKLGLSCPACHQEKHYEWPAAVHGSAPGLVGVAAPAHQSGGTDARVHRDEGGAVTVHCPGCGAPLGVTGREGVVACGYCKCAVRIPASTLRSLGLLDLQPALWWLLWKGPSERRRALETPPKPQVAAAGSGGVDDDDGLPLSKPVTIFLAVVIAAFAAAWLFVYEYNSIPITVRNGQAAASSDTVFFVDGKRACKGEPCRVWLFNGRHTFKADFGACSVTTHVSTYHGQSVWFQFKPKCFGQ